MYYSKKSKYGSAQWDREEQYLDLRKTILIRKALEGSKLAAQLVYSERPKKIFNVKK